MHTFFDYLGGRVPEMLAIAERVAAIPTKRVAPPETRFLERDQIGALFAGLPSRGPSALRDRTLLLFLYNTGARVQEVADLRVADLDLRASRARLHGKGDKWRTCPLWDETVRQLSSLVDQGTARVADRPDGAVFTSKGGRPLTRFGIYKIVRRHTDRLVSCKDSGIRRRISPHVFRHTTAVHLLEAGVEVNVIRGWLGHVSLDTTHRYAEINLRAKQQALELCQPPQEVSAALPRRPVWRDDEALLAWLESL
jgi:site-specific recombinase XerD